MTTHQHQPAPFSSPCEKVTKNALGSFAVFRVFCRFYDEAKRYFLEKIGTAKNRVEALVMLNNLLRDPPGNITVENELWRSNSILTTINYLRSRHERFSISFLLCYDESGKITQAKSGYGFYRTES